MAVFSDSNKFKTLIDEEKKKIEKLYTEIGRMYFESHIDCYEEAFASLMEEAVLSYKNIDEYEEKIVSAKGNVRCPNCKTEVPGGSQFCTACGSKVPTPAVASNICPNCNSELIEGAQFCTTCGSKVTPFSASSSAPTSIASVVSICHKCGATLPYGTKFCTSCGAKVEANHTTTTAVASVVLTCQKCGVALDYGTKFCTSCGAKVEDTTASPVMPINPSVSNPALSTCQKCGALLDSGAKFCTSCGAKRD